MFAGMLTLSPMMVAPVCLVRDPLQLMCTATAPLQFLEWSIMVVDEHGRLEEITAYSNLRDETEQLTEITVNSTTFSFRRISARFASPLTSILSIDSVSIGLNGTVVRCWDTVNSSTSATTTLQIIGTHNSE